MELIHPLSSAKNTILKSNGEVVESNTVNELGIYGVCLWKDPSIKAVEPESQRSSVVTMEEDDDDIPVFDEYRPENLVKDEDKEMVIPPTPQRPRPEILVNEEAGWLLRTKGRDSDEGGVATGFACVDSICLVE